jgi:hypothetical protein
MNKIRVLSAEYQVLVGAAKKPEESVGTAPILNGHPD